MKPSMTQKRDRTRPRPAGLTPKEIAHRDRLREVALKWRGMPPGMPQALARQFERKANDGKTIKDLTDINSESYIVPNSRFRKHCDLNPAWGSKIRKLSDANAAKKKKLSNGRSIATREFCLKGLHPMKGHNLMIDPGRRRCRACFMARMHGKPMTAETMDRLKNAIKDGTPLAEFLHGKPLGGGRKDRSLVITTPAKFYHQREIDPEFASLVDKHITTSNVVGQLARRVRCGHKKQKTDAALSPEMRPTVIAMARLRHRHRTMDGGKYAPALKRQDDKRYRRNPVSAIKDKA
jgi:hypothetical protein